MGIIGSLLGLCLATHLNKKSLDREWKKREETYQKYLASLTRDELMALRSQSPEIKALDNFDNKGGTRKL